MKNIFQNQLSTIILNGNYRTLSTLVHKKNKIYYEDRWLLNLSSNDYLGLASNIELRNEFLEGLTAEHFIAGSSSSRLLTGNYDIYNRLESRLAELYESESALVFNSGYHANIGILPAVTTRKSLILADKLVHASLIDGIRLSDAQCIRYRHNDYAQLEQILDTKASHFDIVIIVTESIFSMDGDEAELNRLVEIKNNYQNVMLYVDEAHAVGVRGKQGLGCCEEQGIIPKIDFLVGTFGKAFASMGAYVICTRRCRDFLINTMRTLIFTTALPPVNLEWTLFILNKAILMSDKRMHLHKISQMLYSPLNRLNGKQHQSCSHIVPYIVGASERASHLAKEIQKAGFYVLPIRPPTVPLGTARLRISLTADCTLQDVKELLSIIMKEDKSE